MSYCLNPSCHSPQNPQNSKFCISCGSPLLLKERYRPLKPIGQGGFGRTFLALDEHKPSQPSCVIKQFYPQAQGTSTVQKAVELFNQEAVRLDELGKHPQIPELLAYFNQDDRQYLIQEFIAGQNLAQELSQRGIWQENQIWQLLQDLLPVLQFCHDRQVIHRDIKPENIIYRSNQQPVLVDFGASKFVTETAINRTGTSIGSPEYVAPEQMRGQAIFASDIYSLGATCLRLLTGRSPFELYDVNHDTWIWQQFLQQPVSASLSQILDKMLVTIPARRYHSAEKVIQDINSQTPRIAKPNISTTPPKQSLTILPTVNSTPSQIDLELEEMKTIFLSSNQSPNHQSKSSSPTPSTSPTSNKIDEELEQMRKKYLGD
ncbi:serine/threonine-protein kinase [Calothrix rhizosoleniae]|uniref:serine/threonine-protein kinase n=1 Tax=Calothrix rhizosoleniae TaxID=888997 RepID=UPI000B498D92|nr:serine/threonine-protein kinase [Calothrix rhizosoleniae]